MDKLKENSRYIVCGLIIFAVMAVYCLRLVDWQIVNGASFLEEASKSYSSSVVMDAARGEILDVNGVGLAVNKTGYSIVLDAAYVTPETENKTILQLVKLLEQRGEKWTDILPIKLNDKGQYEFIAGEEKEIKTLKSKDYLNMNSYATAGECMAELIKKYKVSGFSPADTRDIVSVRYNMTKSGFGISSPYTFANDVSRDTVAIISENSSLLPGATAKVTTMREYPSGSLLPHVVGTIGAISQEEWQTLKDKGYSYNDRLGKSGIEQAFESTLRGKAGKKVVETSNKGSVVSETVETAPTSGNTVFLTIDSRIQKVLNASLEKNIKEAQAYGRQHGPMKGADCVAGGAVVLRVKDFSVLAASTYPTYDLNEYLNNTNYYTSLINDKNKPLINRAFNGIFTPGSCFKPVVACAALQEGVISNSSTITCNHVYTRFAPSYQPTCMGRHGPITLSTALAKSCNVYFFETGYRLGITNLDLYAKRFGLGVKTGIEISESAGVLAGPEEKAAAGGTWVGGNTIQAAIGQNDNQFTPLQLATYAATLANNGTRLQPHLVSKVTDYAQKNVISQTEANQVDNVGVSQQNIDYVKQGMRAVATSGTASSMFSNYGVAIAGKTGTAEVPPHSDNVTFIGFAPYDNPEIAVAVVLEYGATSKFSNSVAKDIFDAYFFGKTVDDKGNIVTPSANSTSSGSASSVSH